MGKMRWFDWPKKRGNTAIAFWHFKNGVIWLAQQRGLGNNSDNGRTNSSLSSVCNRLLRQRKDKILQLRLLRTDKLNQLRQRMDGQTLTTPSTPTTPITPDGLTHTTTTTPTTPTTTLRQLRQLKLRQLVLEVLCCFLPFLYFLTDPGFSFKIVCVDTHHHACCNLFFWAKQINSFSGNGVDYKVPRIYVTNSILFYKDR